MRALRSYSRPARLEKEGALGYPALMQAVLALVVGFVGGGLGGLVGLGGGFIMVPLLIYLFHMSQHDAQGTSLAVLLPPVGILSVLQYWRAGHVDVPVAVWAAAGFLMGGWAGGPAPSPAPLDIPAGVPHARLPAVTEPMAALAISPHGLYEAVPTVPIQLVALVLSPPAATAKHLTILAGIATLLRSPELRARLLAARDDHEALGTLRAHAGALRL